MTVYDRGQFVAERTLTIEPCANGTFLILRGNARDYALVIENTMAFSSAAHMMQFLQGEYDAGGPQPPVDKPEGDLPSATEHCTCWAGNQPAKAPTEVEVALVMLRHGMPLSMVQRLTTISDHDLFAAQAQFDAEVTP